MPDYRESSIYQQNRLDSLSLDVIHEYFAKLNPIAERIAYDIHDTKVNYGKLWDTLNHHEQDDIINDTLIKPEISLHYFDNFPTPTKSASSKSHTSTDSLAAIVLNDIEDLQHETDDVRNEQQVIPLKQFGAKYNDGDGYAFDGRNLRTYSVQAVALKIIQDDILGRFRDEHSSPFSYRTKSQINLHLFHSYSESENNIDRKATEHFQLKSPPVSADQTNKEPIDPESKKTLLNYQRLQCELKKSLNCNIKKSRPIEVQRPLNVNIKPSSITSPLNAASNHRKIVSRFDKVATTNRDSDKASCSSKASKSSSSSIQVFLNTNNNSTQSASAVVNYAVYTDAFLDGEEKANLMQHCSRGDFMSTSSSSAATSEDDEYDIRTDKALDSEEVFLLDRDLNMRKGFDFLNNW